MENQFFLNHFENLAMEIQQPEHQFYNQSAWEKSTADHHGLHQFDSALSSMVSSPTTAASNSNNSENFVIRELIGKLGTIGGNSGEISPHSQPPLIAAPYNNHNNNNGGPMALNSTVAEFSADPGFAERAAKFSCFGSRSFNGRNASQLAAANNAAAAELAQRSNSLNRVSSSPSLKTLGSQIGAAAMEEKNKNSASPLLMLQERMESQEESTISEQTPNGGEALLKPSPPEIMNSRKRKASSKGKAKQTSKGVEVTEDSNAKRMKQQNEDDGNENCNLKAEEKEDSKGDGSEEKQNNKSNNSKPPEPPKDYIHVRARRGQATDSHSLAERVRREKISERMKLLQDLVPGCNKVTGKALMLDEIINYVQSLQRQVEFLSMKLASVNTRMDLRIESLIPKDIFQSNNSLAHQDFQLDSSATGFYGHQSQQNPVIHNNNIPNGNVDPLLLDNALCQNLLGMQLPPLNGFNEGASQYPLTFSEDDLHTIVQMGFGQKTPIQSPSFNGSNQVSEMKIEL